MKIFNQYSLLHFASGIIAYFWGLPLLGWFIFHVIFEYVENTKIGMNFINTYIPMWPGGKQSQESFAESMIGDNMCAVLGWVFASFVDKGGKFSIDKRSGNTKFKSISV